MVTAVVLVDAPVDIASPALSHVAVITTPELLLKRRTQLHQLLSLLLELSL
jgi:hypothetical protein